MKGAVFRNALKPSRLRDAPGNTATASLQRALQINPYDPKLWQLLAAIGLEQGDAAQAKMVAAVNTLDHPRNHICFVLNRASNYGLPGAGAARLLAAATALVLMPVLSFAADKDFIDLHDIDALLAIFIRHSRADAVTHTPGDLVGAETD
jgi:hypothetical protein